MQLQAPSKVGLVVDGESDYYALKNAFGSAVLVMKASGPRGHTVQVENIVRTLPAQVQQLARLGCRRAILVTDLEERPVDYESFSNALAACLDKLELPIPTSCCIPNLMLENWILADIEEVSRSHPKLFLRRLSSKSYEGTNGKRELKQLMSPKVYYSETRHAPTLMKSVRLAFGAKRSPSLRRLVAAIQGRT